MSNSKIVMVLALLLLGSFALPWLNENGAGVPGYKVLQVWLSDPRFQVAGYWLLIPAIGGVLLVLLGALGKGHGIVSFLTSVSLISLVLIVVLGTESINVRNDVGLGLWIGTGVCVLLLIFAFRRSDSRLRPKIR